MGKHIKNLFWILLIGFVLFYVVTNPDGAASAVHTFAGWVRSVFDFFSSLARQP